MPDSPRRTGPVAQRDGLVCQSLGPKDGTIVYDRRTDQAHALDAAATRVWEASDGSRGIVELSRVTGLNEGAVCASLTRLEEIGLVCIADEDGQTRRTLLRSAVLAGAAAPFVASLALPALAAAVSSAPSHVTITGTGNASILDYAVTGGQAPSGTLSQNGATVYLSTVNGAVLGSPAGDYVAIAYVYPGTGFPYVASLGNFSGGTLDYTTENSDDATNGSPTAVGNMSTAGPGWNSPSSISVVFNM